MPFLASRKLIRTNLKKNNLNFEIRYYSPHIGVTFNKENVMHIVTTFGLRGEIEPKNGPEGNQPRFLVFCDYTDK